MNRLKNEPSISQQVESLLTDPECATVLYDCGVELMGRGMFSEAAKVFHKAIDNNHRPFEACANLAYIYYQLRDIEKLLEVNLMAVKINPKYAKGYANLGFIYMEMGKTQEAIEALEKAIDLEPDTAQAWGNLISAYMQKGDLDKAVEIGEKLVGTIPDYAVGVNNLGYAYFLKGDYRQAIRYIDRAKELGLQINPDFLEKLEQYRE